MNERICEGQKLFLEPKGNISRYGRNDVKEGTVVSIKRKYFYVKIDELYEEKFEIETLKNINEDCNSEWKIYFSKEEYEQTRDKHEMILKIRNLFHNFNPTLRTISYQEIKCVYDILKKYMKT